MKFKSIKIANTIKKVKLVNKPTIVNTVKPIKLVNTPEIVNTVKPVKVVTPEIVNTIKPIKSHHSRDCQYYQNNKICTNQF